jgi:GH25 family lysozyme M1 (1,4-beta-N-acetylmuramidase)
MVYEGTKPEHSGLWVASGPPSDPERYLEIDDPVDPGGNSIVNGGDISWYQGRIDPTFLARYWKFVFMNVSDGLTVDPRFVEYATGFKGFDVRRMGYHYWLVSRPVEAQVEVFWNAAKDHIDGVFALDFESTFNEARPPKRLEVKRAFDHLEAISGYIGTFYSRRSYIKHMMDMDPGDWSFLAKYPLWLAEWYVEKPIVPAPWDKITFWQKGEFPILSAFPDADLSNPPVQSSKIDLNVFFGTTAELKALNYKVGDPVIVVPPPDPDPQPNPEVFYGTLQPKQHPLVEVEYQGRHYIVHHWNKERPTQLLGWNGRRWVHTINDKNGDPRLIENGFNKKHLREELGKQTAPNWQSHPDASGEPIYNILWRSIAANALLSNAQIVNNYLEVLQHIHQFYRDDNGLPQVYLDICIMDALGGLWPNCSFKSYIDGGYHAGGRLGTRFMREDAWEGPWQWLARDLIDAIGSRPEFHDLVARLTPLNEFASSLKPDADDVLTNMHGLHGMIKFLWNQSEGMWATGPGWATSHHISQDSKERDGWTQVEFIKMFFNNNDDGKYCTTNDVHIYCKKPSEKPTLTPSGAHQDWQYMFNDINEVLTNPAIKRSVWRSESGTWFNEPYVPGIPARDDLEDWSTRYCMHDLGCAADEGWGTELMTSGYTLGEGDNERGMVKYAQRNGNENYFVNSTDGVILKKQILNKENYQRSLQFKIVK